MLFVIYLLGAMFDSPNSTHYRIIFTGNDGRRVIMSHGRETLDFVFHKEKKRTLDEMSLGGPWGKLL